MVTRYKFLYDRNGKIKSQHGREVWKIGEWQKTTKEAKLCHSGYHSSKGIYQAFSYIQGDVLAKVEVRGGSDISDDKECYQEMRIVQAYRWTKEDSVKLAIYVAELVIDIYEKEYPKDDRPRKAIEAAKAYLKDPSDKNKDAAAYAARAAYAAAYAARAAYAAAYAARAADAALVKKIESYFKRQLKNLEQIQ